MKLQSAHTSHIVGTSIRPAIIAGRRNTLNKNMCAYDSSAAVIVRMHRSGSVCMRVACEEEEEGCEEA